MAAQGQSFFIASGDGDAYTGGIPGPCDDPNVTSVGGTTLVMNAAGTGYGSESVWNWGNQGVSNGWCCNPNPVANTYWGSGGGVSTTYNIPSWQQRVNMTPLGGSNSKRNIPDVAMNSDNIYLIWDDGLTGGGWGGTSVAAPLWAGFTALVNEQAAVDGVPPVGFLSPAFYIIGPGTGYTNAFHDITVGNSHSANSPSKFNSATGYEPLHRLGHAHWPGHD